MIFNTRWARTRYARHVLPPLPAKWRIDKLKENALHGPQQLSVAETCKEEKLIRGAPVRILHMK